ncbi:AP-4 complex subunit beta-1 [Mortierella alpina]|uniref:AP-4 complex subunit beta-1 n=1 Tax=Mortierella alpina TaxID=64518 RepID=A0A9P6J1U5_MORAP|nr:AP-4 complex subunit beta-1 [Mortierella alpina]
MDVAELADAFKGQGAQAGVNHTQLVQRVQELMGQGTDVSSLFATIISSASTRDITVKKAAYSFLAKYGHANEELCFLGINTLHQDCTDLDPIVRSIAIRTLCSLGQRSVLRFMLQPLNTGFQDKNAHVRKTAAMACISLYELDPMFVLESEIADKLYGLIRDRDTQVIVSAIVALERILVDEGGIVINQALAAHLIQRYKDWTPAQLQIVLGVLCRYKPQTEDEIYEIMNSVDDGLQHPSLGIQMATLRLFIWLCQDLSEIQDDVQTTIEETLIRHLDSSDPDLAYASLKHLALLVEITGKLRHSNSPQHIQPLHCRLGDAVVIKMEKVKLCATIALSADEPARGSILDHLSQVASMKDALQLKKSSRTKWFKDWMATNVDVACCAIDSIGMIGSQHLRHSDLNPHSKNRPATAKNTTATCLDRLFQLLALFSDMGLLSEERSASKDRGSGQGSGSSETWIHNSLSELELEDDKLARLLTTILLAIEDCWQTKWDIKRRSDDPSGVLDAFQIKALGLLLLRHLDQEELDRLAKKKKPLRFQYDHDNGSASSNLDSSFQHTPPDHQTGAVSRLARAGGIRILLLEESCQQLALRKQLQSIDSDPLPLITNSPPVAGVNKEKRLSAIKSALEKRSQYAHLLQQQVQDLVQFIDRYSKMTAPAATISDATFLRIRAEQIAVLNLACHLVALSLEHKDSYSSENDTLLDQRLDILAQAVDQLIPSEPEQPSGYNTGHDLLSLEMEQPSQETTAREPARPTDYHVSTDVADRARMIETLFLIPLLSSNPPDSDPSSVHSQRPMRRGNRLSVPHFQSEQYKQIVKQKLVNLFGVSRTSGLGSKDRADHTDRGMESNLVQQADRDWTFQIGFNTLAVAH